MASKQTFTLLKPEQLSKEQQKIMALPFNGNYVIEGGPGSGKTSLAIARAEEICKESSRVLVLMYNRPLMLYIQASQSEPDFNAWFANIVENNLSFSEAPPLQSYTVSTYHSWLSSFYRSRLGYSYPQIAPFEPEWDEIEQRLCSIGKVYNHIIIDEGQDFPLPLLRSLRSLALNMTVFIDPMQAMEHARTTVKEASSIVGGYVYHLSANYRSTREITRFSNLFRHSGEVQSDDSHKGEKPALITCYNYEDQLKVIAAIIRSCKNKSIGIISDPRPANHLYEGLQNELGDEIEVQLYKTLTYTGFDFDEPGVKIVTYGTMKGLEFDVVILPRFTRVSTTGDYVADVNRLHVATSRAKERLFIIKFNEDCGNPDKWIDTLKPLYNKSGYYVIANR